MQLKASAGYFNCGPALLDDCKETAEVGDGDHMALSTLLSNCREQHVLRVNTEGQ